LKSDSTDKQAASASAILAADHIVTELIFQDGNNLTVEDMAAVMTKKEEVNVNTRAYDFVLELVERNPNKFRRNDFGDYQGEAWGKSEGDLVYIIKSVFDREMNNSSYNATAFLSWAKRNGLLVCDPDKRTKKARITDKPINCVCIRRKDLSEWQEMTTEELPF
jgi:hypothetical protein